MKYNTISTSSLGSVARKSTLTLYTDPEFINEKIQSSHTELESVRGELEIVQRALKLQTKRCRQLVTEYTRRLQEKEQQYQSEKLLRDNQLAKVLRALLIFEARLKQEQKYISHQLSDKDYIINKQRDDIDKLSNQYCKHCNQYYSPIPNLESCGGSSEYIGTDYQEYPDYQSSNLESLDSSSETYGTLSEKEFETNKIIIHDSEDEKTHNGKIFIKNNKCGKDSYSKRAKKNPVRKSVGTYFEVLKLRNDIHSPVSNGDNTSNDYDNLESLPAESVSGKISDISERIENIFAKCASANLTEDNLGKHDNQFNSNCGDDEMKDSIDTKIDCNTASELTTQIHSEDLGLQNKTDKSIDLNEKVSQITESIPVFDADEETNDNWYASASDQEEDQQRDIYRNNPVLECMNQILLQNIDDNINSPPKTPTLERKINKNNKRVKFSDEDGEHLQNGNYYETPIQKTPNFYETPQSIYSNDYEQILSKSSEVSSSVAEKSDYYVDMVDKSENDANQKKTKILRPPPALPPKPANLLSKYKIPNQKNISPKVESTESEPDYCSISELNLPTQKAKKINVVAEVNCNSGKLSEKHIIIHSPKNKSHYDLDSEKPDIIVSKNIDRINIQIAKQTPIKNDSPTKAKQKIDQEIPKLPQVSEIIIPEENPPTPASPKKEELINCDNYIKNNTQLLLKNKSRPEITKRSIMMGSTVSSLISSFNNQQLLSEIQNKPLKAKLNKKMFSSFECLQNVEKQTKIPETHSFDKFDLSQNFEEFKLDDCEIEEYNVEKHFEAEEKSIQNNDEIKEEHVLPDVLSIPRNLSSSSTRVELVRATNDVIIPQLNQNSIEHLKKKLDLEKSTDEVEFYEQVTVPIQGSEPNYEQFLECTGLSSKSILTPSRMLSNHKSMLKPKDVKLRSKVKNTIFERQNSAIKYWYEPYV